MIAKLRPALFCLVALGGLSTAHATGANSDAAAGADALRVVLDLAAEVGAVEVHSRRYGHRHYYRHGGYRHYGHRYRGHRYYRHYRGYGSSRGAYRYRGYSPRYYGYRR